MPTENRSSSGFSLLEVLVGLVLMSLAALAAASMFVYAMHGNAASRDLGWVGVAAEQRLETLRTQPFDSLAVGGSLTSDVTGYSEQVAPDIQVRWQVADNSAAIPFTKILTVRASREREGFGPRGEVTVLTVRGD